MARGNQRGFREASKIISYAVKRNRSLPHGRSNTKERKIQGRTGTGGGEGKKRNKAKITKQEQREKRKSYSR